MNCRIEQAYATIFQNASSRDLVQDLVYDNAPGVYITYSTGDGVDIRITAAIKQRLAHTVTLDVFFKFMHCNSTIFLFKREGDIVAGRWLEDDEKQLFGNYLTN